MDGDTQLNNSKTKNQDVENRSVETQAGNDLLIVFQPIYVCLHEGIAMTYHN